MAHKQSPEEFEINRRIVYKIRRIEILKNHIKTFKKVIEAIKEKDITKIDIFSRNGPLYLSKIKYFFGEDAYKKELERRKKERSKPTGKIENFNSSWEKAKEGIAFRKKRINEIGLEAFLKEREERRKLARQESTKRRKEKRKEYDRVNKEKIKEANRLRNEKNKEKNRKKYKEKYKKLTEKERRKLLHNNYEKQKLNKGIWKGGCAYTNEQKGKIMNGLYFDNESKEKRIKLLSSKSHSKISEAEMFLRKISYKKIEEVFFKAEPSFKDSFIIGLKENRIFSLDETCFYGIYLKNNNIFDLLTLENNKYVLGILGRNPNKESSLTRVLIKKIYFNFWEDLENFIKASQKGSLS